MAVSSPIQILDLRHVNARQMRPLLEAEAALWELTLRWDYRSATEMLLEYLNGHVLPGFVTVDHGVITGYTFCVYEGQKAVVGDCFCSSAFLRAPGDEGRDPTLRLLLTHLHDLLRASPGINRIEAQLLLYPAGSLSAFYASEGFQVYPRYFMECDLAAPANEAAAVFEQRARQPPVPISAGDLVLRRWVGSDFQLAAELIHLSYANHVDARINDQYRSLHGSLRFLHNIVRFPGCGVFEASQSWVLADRLSGRLAGVLLYSRLASEVGHITQLCIAPNYRGQGLGAYLLAFAASHLRRAGFAAISLTVSEANEPAVRLYQAAGYTVRRRFDAVVLDLATGTPCEAE